MKSTNNFEQMFKMGKNAGIPLADISKTVTDLCRSMAEESGKILQENLGLVSDQLQRVSTIKQPDELLKFTQACLAEDMKAGMANAERLVKLQSEGMKELASKITGAAHEAGENIREASSDAVKKTQDAVNKNIHTGAGFKGKDRFNK